MGSGVREAIRNNSTAAVVVAIVVTLGAVAYSIRSASLGPPTASTRVFCTIDEGKTVFVTDATQMPPFEYNGKTASRVWMFTIDGGKTKFPGFLERFTPEAKKRFEAALAANKGPDSMPRMAIGDTDVKKPGEGNPWVNRANIAESQKITHPDIPPGAELDIVTP